MSETQNKELAKSYDPASIEAKWYPFWEQQGYFKAGLEEGKPSFSIQLPPPNITGILHMGHAFNHSVMDSLTRFYRMNGYNTMWLPGTDHAGIATQIVVERKLEAQGKNRRDMPRDEFVKEIWKWKDYSGGNILNQMRRLGDTLDWDRLYFTMNDDLAKVVIDCFVDLYEKGLIYRGRRLVNWDPKLQTSVSDLEVEPKEQDGHLWEIRYPAADGSEGVVVATTRPETMFGDQAVAVNPEDERYKDLVGKKLKLPLTDREIPVIADDYVDKEFGSGCVKITPAHDFNDFEVGKRHNLEQVNIMTKTAHLNDNVPEKYRGMDRYEARKAVIEDLKAQGLLVGIKPHKHMVPLVPRTGEVVEPMISEQWFLAMSKPAPEGSRYPGKSLSDLGLEAVQENLVNIFPEQWQKVYKDWLSNIQDWCLSRQLWWGHQIPAWYCDDCGHINVSRQDPTQCEKCGSTHLTRDEDVLDTWFSSALWPFSTLGWPNTESTDLKYWYPTSVMVTGYDIIFFWVARMIFSGMEQMKKEPFKTVFIHGLVRDDKGRKMSKSLGNGIDPLEMAEQYGADALRFNLITGNSPGNDMRFYVEKCEAMRNFANKIWNASRFVMMNLTIDKVELPEKLELEDKWILSKLNTLIREVTDNMDAFELGVASAKIYDFIWDTYCDWYIELTKTRLNGEDEAAKLAAENVLCYVLLRILELLHPFMPFITEEIWQALPHEGDYLIRAKWPEYHSAFDFRAEEQAMEAVKDAISAVRARRAEMNVPPSKKAQMIIVSDHAEDYRLGEHFIKRMAYASELTVTDASPADLTGLVTVVTHGANVYLPLAELVDFEKELERIAKERAKAAENLARIEQKLSNEKFVSKAPEAVVNAEREKAEKARALIAKLDESAAAMRG